MEDAATTRTAESFPVVFSLLLIAGFVLRVLVYRSVWAQPDGDQAIGPLMALRASQGHPALLFWSQSYGGTVITWLEAPFVHLFGTRLWIFDVFDTGMTLLAVFLLRGIGQHFLTRRAADFAAGTYWIFPALWVFWSSREYVFWLPAIVFALATSFFALRWFENRGQLRLLWATGLMAGLSIWSYPLALPLVLPPLAITFWSLRKDLRGAVKLVLATVIGVSPWIAYFLIHGNSALKVNTVTDSRLWEMVHSVTQVLPTALVGGQVRVGMVWATPDASSSHLTAIGLAVFFASVVFTIDMAVRRRVALAACGVSVLLWPAVLAAAHVIIGTNTFRYALIVIPPLLLMTAYLLSRIHLAALLPLLALPLVTYTISTDTAGFAATPNCSTAIRATNGYLMSNHRTVVWASYWLAGPLAICSNNKVVASPVVPIRDQEAAGDAARAARSTYVVFPGAPLDQELQTWTTQHGVHAQRTTSAGFAVWKFDVRLNPTTIGLNSSF